MMLSEGKVFVTGATGTTGGATVRALCALGVDVIAGVHSLEKAPSLIQLGAVARTFNFADVAGMRDAMLGADRLFLVAPVGQLTEELTASAVKAAKAAGISHVVKFSGLDVDADPPLTFETWHRGAEKVIESSGLDWTFLRPNSFMQNFFWNAESIKDGVYYSPFGTASVSYIDARDIGDAAAKVLTTNDHGGAIYKLTGPEAFSDAAIVQRLASVAGKRVSCAPVTLEQTRRAMLDTGMSGVVADATTELLARMADGKASEVSPDVEHLLGHPSRRFSDFLADFIAAFRTPTTV